MEDFFSGLLEILLEIFGESIEVAIREGLTHFMSDWACVPLLWDWALTLAGSVAGLISAWVFPYRLLHEATAFPLSFLFAPLAAGLAAWSIGVILRSIPARANRLATFSGGALFAFAMAVVRWWVVVGLR